MIDLIILGTPIFIGWAINFAILEPIAGIGDGLPRWNHLLASGNSPRRLKEVENLALSDLKHFDLLPSLIERDLTWQEIGAIAKSEQKEVEYA